MPLPTAQLGQMSSLQVPFNIPTVQVEQHPKAWQQALLGILANAGSQVLSQGVKNSMAPDYAPTPAQGFSKFWNGPTINQERAGQLDKQFMDQQTLDQAAEQDRRRNALAMTGQNNERARGLRQSTFENEQLAQQTGHQGNVDELDAERLNQEMLHQKAQDLISQINMTRQGNLADVQGRDIEAQTRERGATAKRMETQDWIMKHSRAPGPQDFDVQGNLLQVPMKSGGGLPPPPGSDRGVPRAPMIAAPQGPTQDEQIMQMLQGGQSPADVATMMQGATARQDATSQRADQYQISDDARAARSAELIEEVKRRLGLPTQIDMINAGTQSLF